MSGTLPTPRSTARMASRRYGTSSRFTMNPEVSFAATGSLPSDWVNANARRKVSSDVVTVRTTSTSGISGTGLKKWSPTNRSARCVAAAMAAMVRLDVFDAKMVAGPHRASSSRHREFLSSRSSVTASTMMSQRCRSAVVVVKPSRLRAASRSPAASFPFSTNLASDFSIPARALSQTCWDTSRTVVSYPAAAATWAIPLPMSPQPSTPTRLMSVMAVPRSPGVDQCADLVCDAEERVRLFARQGVPGFNLPALEPVQHLLQPDLDVLVLRTVAAKNRSGRRSEDQERQERERREQPHQPKGAARRGPQAEERRRAGQALPAAVAHVRDQLDVAKAALERSHAAGHFRRSRQSEPPTSRSECPLNRRERADLRLPGGVVGVAALHLEQLLLLHPRAERAIDHGGLSRDHALSGEPCGAHQPCQHAAACLGRRTRLLFEQCLPQVTRRDPDVLAEREQFGFGEPLADVLLAGLQLRRALDDALERLPADELARHRYALAFVFAGSAGRVSPEVRSGSAGIAGFRATASRNPLNRSIGMGKNVVELFSEEISVTVCR